ncbi:MAG: OmpA family protein [Pseudomonadota bacterium]
MTLSAQGEVRQLPVHADVCAIHHAMTGTTRNGCAAPAPVGPTRSLSPSAAAPDAISGGGYYIHFEFASGDLTPDYQAHLTRLSQVLTEPGMAELCLKLVGHTDAVGSSRYNMKLSEDRARTVRLFLVGALGIDDERVLLGWEGERQLLPGIPAEDARNRRVEILAREGTSKSCL